MRAYPAVTMMHRVAQDFGSQLDSYDTEPVHDSHNRDTVCDSHLHDPYPELNRPSRPAHRRAADTEDSPGGLNISHRAQHRCLSRVLFGSSPVAITVTIRTSRSRAHEVGFTLLNDVETSKNRSSGALEHPFTCMGYTSSAYTKHLPGMLQCGQRCVL